MGALAALLEVVGLQLGYVSVCLWKRVTHVSIYMHGPHSLE